MNWGLFASLCFGISLPIMWWMKPDLSRDAQPAQGLPLTDLLPLSTPGWHVSDVPLGDTELLRTEVKRRLNYTDYVFRRYQRGEVMFDVYIARWDSGALPVWQVAAHTPDHCWTASGWICRAMKFKQELAIDGRKLLPAEWRLFVPTSGSPIHVWYWHIVDGVPYDFGNRFNDTPDLLKRFRNLLWEMRNGGPPQVFIRISASAEFAHLQGEPIFREIVHRLGALALRPKVRPRGRSAE